MPDIKDVYRDDDGNVPAYAWPGGYPIAYYTADDGTLCAACANGGNGSLAGSCALDYGCPDHDQWRVVAYGVLEGSAEDHGEVRCDHCNTIILSE